MMGRPKQKTFQPKKPRQNSKKMIPGCSREKLPWYFRTSFLIVAFCCVGPLMLPLIWWRLNTSPRVKVVYTLGVLLLSALICFVLQRCTAVIGGMLRTDQQLLTGTGLSRQPGTVAGDEAVGGLGQPSEKARLFIKPEHPGMPASKGQRLQDGMGGLQHPPVGEHQLHRFDAFVLINLREIPQGFLIRAVRHRIPRGFPPSLNPSEAETAVAIP